MKKLSLVFFVLASMSSFATDYSLKANRTGTVAEFLKGEGGSYFECNVWWDSKHGYVKDATVFISRTIIKGYDLIEGRARHYGESTFRFYTNDMPEVKYRKDDYSMTVYDMDTMRESRDFELVDHVVSIKNVIDPELVHIAQQANGEYRKLVFEINKKSGYAHYSYTTEDGDTITRKTVFNNCMALK